MSGRLLSCKLFEKRGLRVDGGMREVAFFRYRPRNLLFRLRAGISTTVVTRRRFNLRITTSCGLSSRAAILARRMAGVTATPWDMASLAAS